MCFCFFLRLCVFDLSSALVKDSIEKYRKRIACVHRCVPYVNRVVPRAPVVTWLSAGAHKVTV